MLSTTHQNRSVVFLELTSILLWGQLKIHFAAAGTSNSAVVRFDTVGEEFYRDAIDLLLNGFDPTGADAIDHDHNSFLISESWPIHFRNEALRYRPKNQQLLAAAQWPSVMSGFQRELFPAGALLVTERELVLISEEKISPRRPFCCPISVSQMIEPNDELNSNSVTDVPTHKCYRCPGCAADRRTPNAER